jgi:MFS family permease
MGKRSFLFRKKAKPEQLHEHEYEEREYRTYPIRYFGLLMLVLLNIVTSLNWTVFAPTPQFAADYYSTSLSTINWFANAYLLCYLVSSPISSWVFERYNIKFGVGSQHSTSTPMVQHLTSL